MKFKVSEDKKFLILVDSTQLELDQLHFSFTKKVENWFIIKKNQYNNSSFIYHPGAIISILVSLFIY